jgi:fluoroacetyl-CoA thioesterase
VKIGARAKVELVVTSADTAMALRSSEVPVLGTSRVVALAEEAAVAALAGHLSVNETSVSARVELAHLAPVLVGSKVRAVATLEKAEGRRLIFNVAVNDEAGLVAAGKMTRIVVDTAQFMERAR